MKILIVSDAWSPQVNGVVRTLIQTRDQLLALGHEVSLITPDQFRTLPCPTYPDIRLAWRPARKVAQLIEQFDPDCLHIATEGPLGWAARRHALRSGRRFTTAYHTQFPEYIKARTGLPLWVGYAIMRLFHAPSSGVMVATDSMENQLRGRGFARIKRWSRGVDLQRFQMPSTGSTSKPHNKHNTVFLFAGRVAVEKNIEAFLRLDLPGEKWVAGDGPQRASLQAQYPKVRWLGMLNPDALAKVYQQADVFVFPSLTDTFGLVLLEAMASGLPVAAYPVVGPKDVVGHSGAGILDDNLWMACIKALDIPKELARQHAEQFTWQNATAQFVGNLALIDKTLLAKPANLPSLKQLPAAGKGISA